MRIVPHPVPSESSPLYGVDAQTIDVRTIDLTNARIEEELNIGARDVIWVIDATSLTANLPVRYNSQAGGLVVLKKGMFLAGVPFSQLFLNNEAQAGESITLFTAREGQNLIRIDNPASDASLVTFTKPSVLDTITDVACANAAVTQVLAALSTRRKAMIQNLSASADVRIGDSNVTATRGTRLGPGELYEVETTESIHVRNDSGASVSVSVAWTAD